MKVHISPTTVGRYGGLLKDKLRYLPNLIQFEIEKSGFVSSFDDLWLNLAYPPLYVLPGVVSLVNPFFEVYRNFPYSRVDRKHKKIEITLKAPEFSEHFDSSDLERYSNRFQIEERYKNLTQVELGLILIDKYLEAMSIIESKLKPADNFDVQKFEKILLSVKDKISDDFLKTMDAEQMATERAQIVHEAMKGREERKLANKPKDKRVRDLRMYYAGFPEGAFYPYDYQYVEIFRNLLRNSKILCPTYHHLYIKVANTFEDGLMYSVAAESWYVYGIAVLDYDKYLKGSEVEKQQMIIDVISDGLIDIARTDHLDMAIMSELIRTVKNNGLNTELIFKQIENRNHVLTISYLSGTKEEQCPVYFKVLDKKTNHSNRVEIGRAANHQIYFWLQKVTLTRDKVKIKPSNSIEAGVSLGKKTIITEYSLKDILEGTI